MEKIKLRRTIGIGSYESLSVEAEGEGETLDQARLDATKKVLTCMQMELVRIVNVRPYNASGSVYDMATLELNGINKELEQYS